MAVVEKSALVQHTPEQMFGLVYDVASYQDFLPWCKSSRKISESEHMICGELEVSRIGISQKFATCNSFVKNESMAIRLKEGPFRHLEGDWTFTPLGEAACKVELRLEFEFSGRLIDAAFGRVFAVIANELVDAFCKRADELYG